MRRDTPRRVWLAGGVDEQTPGSRVGMATGAVLLVILTALVAVVAGSDDASPPPAPISPTTSLPENTVALSGPRLLDISKLTGAGLVVFDDGRDDVVFVSFEGKELARGPWGGWYPAHPERGVDVDVGGTLTDGVALDDPVAGCEAVYGQGGVRAGVCGSSPSPTEIRLLSGAGRVRVLSGPVDPSGHWRYAVPSPDGRWVLAQWSGECEVPTAYLFALTGGPGRPVIGREFATSAVGWAPDGRAVVTLWPGACSADTDGPGTYLLDPTSGEGVRVHALHQAVLASLSGYGNRLEGIMRRAIDELGLELCCNQPSHGGDDVEAGFIFEGHAIALYGAPQDAVGGVPPEPGALRFDCGRGRYYLADHGPTGAEASGRSDPRLLRRAAARLVTRLYCTAGPFDIIR